MKLYLIRHADAVPTEEFGGPDGDRPDIDALAGWVIGTRKARVGLAKGAAALIECDVAPGKGMGTLRWLITPEWVGAAEPSANGKADHAEGTEKRKQSSGKRR